MEFDETKTIVGETDRPAVWAILTSSLLLAAVSLTGCGPGDQCSSDDDCPDGQICETNTCVDPDWTVGTDAGPETEEGTPDIEVPGTLELETDGAPGRDETIFEVQNRGEETLRVTRAELEVGSAFSLGFPDSRDAPPEEDADEATPFDVEPGESRLVRVVFEPNTAETARDGVVLESNDPDESLARIELTGRVDDGRVEGPCVDVQPSDVLEFDDTPVATTASKSVTFTNCSQSDELLLSNRSAQPSPPFSLDAGGEVDVAPGESIRQTVQFTPADSTSYEGTLNLETDVPDQPVVRITLRGAGVSDSDCPTAKAVATLQENSGGGSDDLTTEPYQTIELDGRDSTAQVGNVDRWEWTVANRPTDSTAQLTPSSEIAEPTVLLDLVGSYEFHLTVYDTEGNESCNTAVVEATAEPDEEIYVEVVWDTPNDSDQTDSSGADLDLHYLNPQGNWNEDPWDIYWDNKSADWGTNSSNDDPQMVAVDDDGAGPEAVAHSNPVSGNQYTVGVYYYDESGFGTSYATTRLYLNAQQSAEYVDEPLEQFWFWKVALIEWPTGNILPRNTINKSGFPQE